MAVRDVMSLRLSRKRPKEQLIRVFLAKYSEDEHTEVLKRILYTVIDKMGSNWDPVEEGFGSLFKTLSSESPKQAPQLYSTKPVKPRDISALDDILLS